LKFIENPKFGWSYFLYNEFHLWFLILIMYISTNNG